ncbi:unnamed protein product [Schistosoma rodhaini]|uniref:Centriolin n=2 Tax=Schistosoma rodhaini TaxID=6188 RepID=A0AA85FBI3_9TREM|nr:unnamed protein product [Schistosoma rodhaini]CAH8493655.1 unnamed protein product [Schistosoma rodhaini]
MESYLSCMLVHRKRDKCLSMAVSNSKDHSFVQYMTSNLLMKKTSKEPVQTYAVNLSNKNNNYKIEKIENLEQFCELRQLNLSYNRICKISGLSTLCHLTVLNISHNCITSFNGIQSLSNLLVLKVNNNQITSIPKWLPKRLPKLKTIHLHYNQIDTLHQITYLRSLSNLTAFTFEGNPAVKQLIINTHNSSSSDEAVVKNTIEKFDTQSLCRIFIIFHLCSLILLDNKEVLPFERQVAEQRFSQVEISRYLNKLNMYESQLKEVETKNSLLKKDLSHEQFQLNETLRKRKLENDLISHLQEELHAKDNLLHLKSEELARACLKHFELEQGLAFHKIDEKLGLVGSCLSKPRDNSSDVHQIHDTGDQPYLGKCMFQCIPTNNHSFIKNKCSSNNHLINVQKKMCSNINDNNNDCNKCYPNCLDNKLENDCNDIIHENSNITHQYTSSDIVLLNNVNQELNPELDHNLISLNDKLSQLPQSNPPPNRSSPTVALFRDKGPKSPTLDKPLDDVKSSDLLEEKKPTRSSSQPENKSLYKSFKQSDVEQIQMKLSHLQSELLQLRVEESTMQNDTVHHNNSNVTVNNNSETNELNNRIKILESELNKMWTMAHLLKFESSQYELNSRNNITTNNVYLNSFVTLPKSSSDEAKHANPSKSNKSPKYFSYEFSRQDSPHQKRERRFSLPSKDIDLKQILFGDNFNHVDGTTSVGSEFDSCEEFVDSPRKLINSCKKKENHQFTLSHDRGMGSVTPSTPSSRTTGTGRSALLSTHTPRSNDLYTMDHLSKPLDSGSSRNTMDHSRKNLHHDVHASINSCIPCESTNVQANIYNTQESVPNIQLERTRGSGVGGPLPLKNASQPSSFDSFQLYSYTGNSNENNNDNNNNNQSSENSSFQKSDSFRRYHISRLPKPNPTRTLSRGSDILQFNSGQAWSYNRKSRKLNSKCRSYRNFSGMRSCVRAKWSKQKHKQPRSRSDSHKSEKIMTDYSLSDHAEELLNLIVMSRDACSMEVDRMREDLSRLYKANSKRHTRLDHNKQSDNQHIYGDCVRPMRNHIDSLKTRYSPAGDDNDDCSFTECQPTVYQKAQSHTNYQQYPSESNNNNSNDKNLSSNHSQYKPHVRRLLPHTKSFDDHDGFDLNDHQIDNSNGNNDDFCAADNNYDDQMNYFYHYQDYKRQNEPPVNFKDHWLQNGVPDLNWNKDQKNFIPSSSNRRPTSLHKSRVFSRRPRTRSIPRQHPTNANFSPYHNNTSRRFSRGHSLDYTHQHLKQSVLRNSTTSLLNDTEYHDIDPTSETKAIIHLTDELFGLRQGLKRTREANSERLEVALRHISLLELELQRQRCLNHDAEVARQREVERTRWEKRLAATLNELKYCQTDIGKLREQVDQLESSKKTSDQSELKLERQRLELDQTKATLDAQKEEITNLNNLLNSLLGLNPNDVSPNDLQRLQVGLLDLHKHMQPDCANQYCHYQRQQHVPNSINPRQTLHRTQSLMTGLTGVPANERMNRVDWLNPNNTAAAITQSSVGNHQLYCNVPEHHDLEDCLGQLQYRIEELCDQHEITQNKLRHNMKIRRKLECQLEEQDSILNRLKSELMSCQEDLKIAKQEVTRLSCEKETAQKSKHEQLTGIVTDLANLEATVSQRRAELSTLDTNIQDSDQQLSIIKAQAKEAVSKYEEAKREYDNVKSQLDMIRSEKSLADENLEQLRTKLSKTKIQVERLESNKSNLENQLTQLEDAVNTKKLEYNQLLPNLSELETRLTRTQHDIEVGAERIRSDQHLRLEDERLSATRQAELTRLARQIEEDKLRLELLAQDTEAKKSELELIKAEKHRELENSNSVLRELANQTAIKQRELNETQASLNASLDEKERILQSVKTLRLERDNIRTELEHEQKSVAELTALVTRQKREFEHLTEMSHLEESRILNLSSQQRDLINQLEKLQIQLNEEKEELREREVAKIKKNTEYENVRKDVVREQSELEHIQKEKEQVELELTHLRQERDITKTQWDNFQSKIKDLENQKVQLNDSISEANLTLALIKAESESASNLLRQKNIECNAALADCDRMSKQTSDSRDELNIAQQRLQKANDLKQSIESSLNEQRRQRVLLSDELNHLEEAVHTGRLAKELADESREASEAALKSAVNKLNKIQTEKKILEEELDSLRMSKDNELHYLDERLRNTRQHLESVESELSQKSLKLNEVSEKLNTLQNEYIKKERIKSNSPELEKELEKCKQQQIASRLDDRNKQPTYNQFNDLKIDNVTKLHDNNSNLLQALMDTKSALIAAQRESKRLKRRTAREVAELERVAEEQCNRAGDLTEQLSLAKRQYAQLKSQITTYGILMDEVITIASQTELTEHGKRLEAALSAVRAELEQHNNTMNASVVDENACSNSILFGQRIREVLNPDSDSRIVKDRSSNDHEIQEITDHNYTVNGLQKSLLLLTNSFHEINHSPNNFHNVQSLTDSLNGLCKKSNHFSHRLFVNNNDSEHIVDDPELNYTTSGLGSSVNPGTQIASNSGSVQENSTILSPSTLGESKPVKSNNWKQNVSSSSVGRQRSHEESASLTTSGFVNHSRTPRHFKSGSSRSSRPG